MKTKSKELAKKKTKLQLWHEILDSRDFRVILYCIAKREPQFQKVKVLSR